MGNSLFGKQNTPFPEPVPQQIQEQTTTQPIQELTTTQQILETTRPKIPEMRHPADMSSKNPICGLPPIEGECRAAHSRFYFDPKRNECVHFTYGGCSGNDNNFEEMDICFDVCGDEDTAVGNISGLGYAYYGYHWKSNPEAVEMMDQIRDMFQGYLNDGCAQAPNGCGTREWPEKISNTYEGFDNYDNYNDNVNTDNNDDQSVEKDYSYLDNIGSSENNDDKDKQDSQDGDDDDLSFLESLDNAEENDNKDKEDSKHSDDDDISYLESLGAQENKDKKDEKEFMSSEDLDAVYQNIEIEKDYSYLDNLFD